LGKSIYLLLKTAVEKLKKKECGHLEEWKTEPSLDLRKEINYAVVIPAAFIWIYIQIKRNKS
jgi:hypothetical protein